MMGRLYEFADVLRHHGRKQNLSPDLATGRRGEDGHRDFSFPALIAPYAGTMTAVYAWYPKRYDAEDAFRMGNYSLLAYAAQNVGLEFIYSGPHSLLSRMHLNNGHRAPEPGTNPGSNP